MSLEEAFQLPFAKQLNEYARTEKVREAEEKACQVRSETFQERIDELEAQLRDVEQ